MSSECNYGELEASRELTGEEAAAVNRIAGDNIAEEGHNILSFDEVYGSHIDDTIKAVMTKLEETGITISGSLEHHGDGRYKLLVENGDVRWEEMMALSDQSDEDIINEFQNRFGKMFIVTVGSDFVRDNQTLCNEGCKTTDDAYEKLEKEWYRDDSFGDDSGINPFVCAVFAKNEADAVSQAEQIAPRYRCLMQAEEFAPVRERFL